MRTREGLSWVAGFFEADGSVFVDKRGFIGVSVGQSELSRLKRINREVGFGTISEVPKRAEGKHWRWVAGSWEHCQAFCAMVWPFITEFQRREISRALTRGRKTISRKSSVCKHGHSRAIYGVRRGPRSRLFCRECQRLRAKNRRAIKNEV